MATSLTTTMNIAANWTHAKTQTGSADTQNQGSYNKRLSFANGAGAGQANEMFQEIRTLAAGLSETLDFSGGVGTGSIAGELVNLLGDTIVFTKVKAIVFWLLAAADTGPDGATVGTACSSIKIGNAAAAQALAGASGFLGDVSDTFRVFNGGFAAFGVANAGGVTVANGSSDRLRVVNEDGSNAAKYVITVIGAK